MSIIKKQHVSKSGKSVLIFRKQDFSGTVGSPQHAANGVQGNNNPQQTAEPVAPVNSRNESSRMYGKLRLTNLQEFQDRTPSPAKS